MYEKAFISLAEITEKGPIWRISKGQWNAVKKDTFYGLYEKLLASLAEITEKGPIWRNSKGQWNAVKKDIFYGLHEKWLTTLAETILLKEGQFGGILKGNEIHE